MLQFTCSTLICLTQYLGLGVVNYQSLNGVLLTTPRQSYYCQRYNNLYTCTKSMDDTNMDY
jgi:hypothetical protein